MLPRPDRPHDQLLSRPMKTSQTSGTTGTIVGAIGGLAAGYVLSTAVSIHGVALGNFIDSAPRSRRLHDVSSNL